MIHLDCLSIKEVLFGSTITVMRDGVVSVHTVSPGVASYLIQRYRNHSSISVTE